MPIWSVAGQRAESGGRLEDAPASLPDIAKTSKAVENARRIRPMRSDVRNMRFLALRAPPRHRLPDLELTHGRRPHHPSRSHPTLATKPGGSCARPGSPVRIESAEIGARTGR